MDKQNEITTRAKEIQLRTITTRGALQAFTDYTCGVCNRVTTWHNSNTPRICYKCAEKKARREQLSLVSNSDE